MGTNRLEAFSDGVIAIIITIMVLELKVPHGHGTLEELLPLWPVFLSYLLSFVYVGIYWANHHHLLHTVKQVDGGVLWANLFWLFWLSLMPFTTGWMGENHFSSAAMLVYGFNLMMSAVSWVLLQRRLVCLQGPDATLGHALGRDWKGKLSPVGYLAGMGLAFVSPWLSGALYVAVALMWLVPDRRLERTLKNENLER
jgi:uncharacterized membrane protein